MLHRRLRKILTLALLSALAVPALMTGAIAVHEAAHHRHDGPSVGSLLTVVHGHHHDQEIEEHAHEAVAAKVRAGSMAQTPATSAIGGEHWIDSSADLEGSLNSRPLLEPPRSSVLCTWRL